MSRIWFLAICLACFSISADALDSNDQRVSLLAAETIAANDTDKDGKLSEAEFLQYGEKSRTAYRSNETRVYGSLDVNHDGKVSVEEVRDSIRDGAGRILTDKGSRLAALMDTDGDGLVSEKEYRDYNSRSYEEKDRETFAKIDADGNGFIDAGELAEYMRQLLKAFL